MRTLLTLATMAGLAFCGFAFGQDAKSPPPTSAMPPHDTTMHHDMSMANMSGMHDMPATVTHVDHKTGIVEVESMNMKLRVHFPANTIASLKNGDKITLHLGYSKG